MGIFNFLFSWYNAPFLVALGCCLLFAALQVMADFGDSDADGEADIEIDSDAPQGFGSVLAILGIGRLPLMLVLTALLGILGASGLIINALLIAIINLPAGIAIVISLLAALTIAFFGTGQVSRLLARLAGNTSTAIGFAQLVGRSGVVVSANVTQHYGRVAVRDSHGSIHTVFAITREGTELPAQSEVALLEYDEQQRRFLVRELTR